MTNKIDTQHTLRPVCPKCGHEDVNAWEIDFGSGLDGDAQVDCGYCGTQFVCYRSVSVSYSTKLVETKENEHGSNDKT